MRIGDRAGSVVDRFGEPTVIRGDDFEGGIYYYAEGTKYNEMWIAISEDSALGFGVIFMHLYPPYGGKTREGVGIGMIREHVLKYLPPPDSTYFPFEGVIVDPYFYARNSFSVQYIDNKIYLITMVGPIRYR